MQQQELKLRATVAAVAMSVRRRNISWMLETRLMLAIKKKPGIFN